MQLEVGSIVEGKVTGITNFGAFVELPDGKTGMVHISEVASTYVKEIRDYIQENQMVKVKVLSISEDGKVSLSVKRADPAADAQAAARPPRTGGSSAPRQGAGNSNFRPSGGSRPSGPRKSAPRSEGWRGPKPVAEPATFEDMISRFKQSSDDKMSDLKRNMDTKRGTSGKRGGGGTRG